MKFSTALFGLATILGLSQAQIPDENHDGLPDGDIPDCAMSCFTNIYLTNLPAFMACQEANLFLCFCKSTTFVTLYKQCVCRNCPAEDKQDALQFGLDTCTLNNATIGWMGNTC